MLIGQKFPQAILSLEVRSGGKGEPYAIRTALGWALNGALREGSDNDNAVSHFICGEAEADVSLERQVEHFWKIDIGNTLADSLPQMSADKHVLDVWNKSVHRVDGHYELDIPFKSKENRVMAEKCLSSLGRRLAKDPSLHQKYKVEMDTLVAKGHAEKGDDDTGATGSVWYQPHHGVTNPNKPDKLRIVFDCDAEYQGTSLNKRVLQGPDMTNKLLGILLRFRENPVAIMGDIEAMFHQVKVSPDHRDVLRFLWLKDGNLELELEVYRMCVHLFGVVWSPSCASFALRQSAAEEKDNAESDPDTVASVMNNFYADDCRKSVDTEKKATKLVSELSHLLTLGGFRLTK